MSIQSCFNMLYIYAYIYIKFYFLQNFNADSFMWNHLDHKSCIIFFLSISVLRCISVGVTRSLNHNSTIIWLKTKIGDVLCLNIDVRITFISVYIHQEKFTKIYDTVECIDCILSNSSHSIRQFYESFHLPYLTESKEV